MLRLPIFNLNELSKGLEILRKDLRSISDIDGEDKFPILYDSSFSEFEYERDEKPTPKNHRHHKPSKILEALDSCNFYLNALSMECTTMESLNNYGLCDEKNKENDEDIFSFSSEVFLKKYFEVFKQKAWKCFAETNSFYKLLMTACKPLASQIDDAEEVLYAFKHSLSVYEQSVLFDVSCPDNTEKILCALADVKSSTRNLQSYLWMVKTLMTHLNK